MWDDWKSTSWIDGEENSFDSSANVLSSLVEIPHSPRRNSYADSQPNMSSWNTSYHAVDTVNLNVSERSIQPNVPDFSEQSPMMPMQWMDTSTQQQTVLSTQELSSPETVFSPNFLEKEAALFDGPFPSMDLASLVQDTTVQSMEEKDGSFVASWFDDRTDNRFNGQNDFQHHQPHYSPPQFDKPRATQSEQKNISYKVEPDATLNNNHPAQYDQQASMAPLASKLEEGKQPISQLPNIQGYPQMMVPGVIMYTMPVMGNFPPQMYGMMPVGMPLQMNIASGMQFQQPSPFAPRNEMPFDVNTTATGQAEEKSPNQAAHTAQATPFIKPSHFVNPAMLHYPTNHSMPVPALSTNGHFAAFQPIAEPPNRKPNFVNIARKPEKPQASSILKSLMEEEAKKKEKKLERNRDSARESRRKQQSYVGVLENGIKRLQINREYIVSYQWGLTKTDTRQSSSQKDQFGIGQFISIVCGEVEFPSYVEDIHVLKRLMASTRHRRAVMSLSGRWRAQLVAKCFAQIGTFLARIRDRIIALQIISQLGSPFTKDLENILRLTHTQKQQLGALHLYDQIRSEIYAFILAAKSITALQAQAHNIVYHASALELPFSQVCASKQLHQLLQFTENEDMMPEDMLFQV